MKKIKLGLFAKIVIAILLGALLGEILPMAGVRVLKTFNVFFAGLLKFIVPLLVIGLVTPAIADVGKGAGKMLLAVMAISYFSTVCAGFFGYAAGSFAFPHYLAKGLVGAGAEAAEIQPFFTIKILPICDVLTALALSFMTGIGIVFTGSKWLRGAVDDFAEIVHRSAQPFRSGEAYYPQGDNSVPAGLHPDDDQRNDRQRQGRSDGGSALQGDRYGDDPHDHIPCLHVRGRRSDRRQKSVPVHLEHASGVFHRLFDLLVGRIHPGYAGIDLEDGGVEGYRRVRNPALRQRAHGRKRHQTLRQRDGDRLDGGSPGRRGAVRALHLHARHCGGGRSRGDRRSADGIARVGGFRPGILAGAVVAADDVLSRHRRLRPCGQRYWRRRDRASHRPVLRRRAQGLK